MTTEELKVLFEEKQDAEVISALQNKDVKVKPWGAILKEYDSNLHDIMDHNKRKMRKLSGGKTEDVSRIRLDFEKLIAQRMTEFMFALPVKRIITGIDGDKTKQDIANAIETVYTKNRIDSENLKRAKEFFSSCEICTQWVPVPAEKNNIYGFSTTKKLRIRTYSPMSGYSLYPLFDEYGDMVAMSLGYTAANEVTYFETYTADKHLRFENGNRVLYEDNPLGKIPFIYACRPKPIWDGVQHLINELEFTLSRNSDVISYNSSPIIKVVGDLIGQDDKDKAQRVIRVQNGGDVSYVSWSQSTQAVQDHVNMILRLIWMQMQLPDLSFENIKGLGAVSGEARKTLLTDAHLKVGDEKGVFLEFFDREANVVKAYLKKLNPEWEGKIDEISIEHVITPFIQNDEAAEVQKWLSANGGKPLVSHLDSIKLAGFSANPQETYEQIQKEEKEAGMAAISGLVEEY